MVNTETERKYAVPDGVPVPDLSGLDHVDVETQDPVTLEATYFDTADRRLLASRVTLRRRTGGSDAGWHLKLPDLGDGSGDSRTEVHARLTKTDVVPAALRKLLVGLVRDAELRPLARLTTTRATWLLRDDAGELVAEIADDTVDATPGPDTDDAVASTWRELEVELKNAGSPDLLDLVEKRFADCGVTRADYPSKIGRVLSTPASSPKLSRSSSAGAVATAALRTHVDDLLLWDPQVRQDADDAVHKARVSTRRMRSNLRTYRKLFDRYTVDRLRTELQWLAGVLGAARDAEVMRDRLLEIIRSLPEDQVVGPVAERVRTELGGAYERAHRAAVRTMSQRRYLRLLDDLAAFCDQPPYTERADRKAKHELPKLTHATWTKVQGLADAANASGEDHDLHEVRKAAKRARYAGEALTPVFGGDAQRYAEVMEDLQEVLGEHQDSVVTREVLHSLAAAAEEQAEDPYTYGVIAGLEVSRGAQTWDGYADALSAASKKKLRRWLTP